MHLKHLAFLVILLFITCAATVSAEEKFGIPVYPGAKLDTSVTSFVKKVAPESAGYRTKDSITRVIDYYRRQAGMELMDSNAEAALFVKGDVAVAVQSPWLNRKTGRMMEDTLIMIRRHKK